MPKNDITLRKMLINRYDNNEENSTEVTAPTSLDWIHRRLQMLVSRNTLPKTYVNQA